MKKIYIVFAILILLFSLAYYIKQNIIRISSFFLERSLGVKVSSEKVSWGIESSEVLLGARNVKLSGEVSGNVQKMEISFGFPQESILKNLRMEKFDLKLKDGRGTSFRSLVFGIPKLELKEGVLKLENRSIEIKSLETSVDKTQNIFELYGKLSIGGIFSDSRIDVRGTAKKGFFQVSGDYQVKNLNLRALSEDVNGTVDLQGSLSIKGERLESKGNFSRLNARIRTGIFKKPYSFVDGRGHYELVKDGDLVTLKLSVETPSGLNARFTVNLKGGSLVFLRLSTGEIEVRDLIEYLELGDIERYLETGKFRVKNLEYSPNFQILCDLELEGLSISVRGIKFEGLRGPIRVEDGNIKLLGIQGIMSRSLIKNVRGNLRLKDHTELRIFGEHEIHLPDTQNLLSIEELTFEEGKLIGYFELAGEKEKGFSYRISGNLDKAQVIIRGIPYLASGKISVSEEGVDLNPVMISGDGTELKVRGKIGWSGHFSLSLDGIIPTTIVEFFNEKDFHFQGHAKGNIRIEKGEESLEVIGKLDLTESCISFREIFFKPRQVPMTVSFEIDRDGNVLLVKDVDLDLSGLKISGFGEYVGSSANFFLKVFSDNLREFSESVYFKGIPQSGEILCEVMVKDLSRGMDRLPVIKGFLKASLGPIRLEKLEIEELRLFSAFEGEKTTILLEDFRTPYCELDQGRILVEGKKNPKIEGDLSFRKFQVKDLDLKRNRSLPKMEDENLFFRTYANLRFHIQDMALGDLNLKRLSILTQKEGGRFSGTFKGLLLGGGMEGEALISLSQDPKIELTLNFEGVDLKEAVFLLGGDRLFEGKTSLHFSFSSQGDDLYEIIRNSKGILSLMSSEGRIRRWNLIAKILHLLNFYEIARIPIDFSKDGLKYRKMAGTFTLEDGSFQTNDFLIESPSLILKGEGKIDLSSLSVFASISVSPFVALEKTLEKIPILRNIFHSQEGSFFSVYYNVSGNLTDPDVRIDVMRTVPKKALSIVESLLRYTFSAFERLFGR